MKKIFVMFALMTGAVSAFAQNVTDSASAETGSVTMTRELYPGQEDGDLYPVSYTHLTLPTNREV